MFLGKKRFRIKTSGGVHRVRRRKMLTFKIDEVQQLYVWQDESGKSVSAHFDYEQDALDWKEKNAHLFAQQTVQEHFVHPKELTPRMRF